ncbi:MAG: SGNH/GDSL hydrolase family protein [Lachnospiraceae bacterium]
MRKFKNIFFLLILITILAGLSHGLNEAAKSDVNLIQNRNKNLIKIQQKKKNTIDVLVLGDSESYTSISPLEMWGSHGFTSYVCGQSGQKIQETYYTLKTALQSQSPKLVVLETNVLFRSQTGISGIRESVVQTGKYYFPLFQFHDVWKPLLLGKRYAVEDYAGFIIRDTVASYDNGEYMKETNGKEVISDIVNDNMKEIIELCNEKGAKLLLLSAPSPLNYNYRKHNAIKEYAKENSLEYQDLNLKTKELDINWETDSMDMGDHLNLFGAYKVTKYLGNYFKVNYDLPDHRGDATYQEWEDSAKNYETITKDKLEAMQ